MAFSVVEGEGRTFWVAGDGSSTYYKGQLLSYTAASKAQTYGTVLPLAVPAGAGDLTNFQVVAGIVTGFNYRTPKNVTTVGSIPIENGGGAIATQAQLAADEKTGNEGMYSEGDTQLLIQMTEVLPWTIIKGPIYNAAYGTAPTLLTATAVGGTDGMVTADTTNACDFTNVAKCGTIYCRTGANAGIYRVSKDTSTTAPSVNTAFPFDTSVGDTYVRVPIKQGAHGSAGWPAASRKPRRNCGEGARRCEPNASGLARAWSRARQHARLRGVIALEVVVVFAIWLFQRYFGT